MANAKLKESDIDDLEDLKDFIRQEFGNLRQEFANLHYTIHMYAVFGLLALAITGLCLYSQILGGKYFGRERVQIAKSATYKAHYPEECGNGTATAFGLSYKGYMTDVTVAHIECSLETVRLLPCSEVDIAFTGNCPRVGALDGRVSEELYAGDSVIAFGFTNGFPHAWRGTLGGSYGENESLPIPFQGNPHIPYDGHIVYGQQNKEESGAAVFNSFGLVGVASMCFRGPSSNSRQVGVIPMHYVLECMQHYGKLGKLPTKSDCGNMYYIGCMERERLIRTFVAAFVGCNWSD